MKRSTGVTVIAILSFVGSGFTILMAIVMAMVRPWSRVSSDLPGSPVFFKAIMVGVVLFYSFLALWGVLTGVGLLRLRNWARVSIIVFSTLLILAGIGSILPAFAPLPSSPNEPAGASAMVAVRVFMGVFAFLLLGTGVWWLVYFTRTRVKEQFVSPAVATDEITLDALAHQRRRPLSITIIAWLLLGGCMSIPLNLWLHMPLILFTRMITSRPAATIYCVVITVLNLYVGVGLLRLRPMARTVGIAYFVFAFVNGAVFYFAPGGHTRMSALMNGALSMLSWVPRQDVAWQLEAPYWVVYAAIGQATGLVPLYFLITRQRAFGKGLPT